MRELHRQVGGANRLSLDCADVVKRPVDERVVNVVANVHRGSIREPMIQTHCSAVFANRIHASARVLVGNRIIRRLPRRPAVEEWLESGRGRQHLCPKCGVGHKRNLGVCKALPDAFVIHKKESAILQDRSAQAGAELVHSERRNLRRIEG